MRAPGLTQTLSQPDGASDQTLPAVCHLLRLSWVRLCNNDSWKRGAASFCFFSPCVSAISLSAPASFPISSCSESRAETESDPWKPEEVWQGWAGRFQSAVLCLFFLSLYLSWLRVVACAQFLWLKGPVTLNYIQAKRGCFWMIHLVFRFKLFHFGSWLFSVILFFFLPEFDHVRMSLPCLKWSSPLIMPQPRLLGSTRLIAYMCAHLAHKQKELSSSPFVSSLLLLFYVWLFD